MPVQPSWVEHSSELVSVVGWVGASLVAVIVAIGGALIKVGLYIGNKFTSKLDSMEAKLDTMHQIQLLCDGCAQAAEEFKRRSTDKI